MHTSLYTAETAKWYSLLLQAQSGSGRFMTADVESYIADMLFRFTKNADGILYQAQKGSSAEWNQERRGRLIRMQCNGERCLVTAGFFPEHANVSGLSLSHFIERGRHAYQVLSIAMPNVNVYSYINSHFMETVHVLQQIGELSGVCRSIDLMQACELWQQEGSSHGLKTIRATTSAFPSAISSASTH